jgi:GR25 family glycosyltransferase involved in LPS biosynthesis
MYGHLDMIYDFYYNSDKNFGIFCEDDILINNNLSNYLPTIIKDVETMNLDILLLGYLIEFKIEHFFTNFSTIKKSNLENDSYYHKYPEDLWGTQMYLITRNYAKFLLDNYYYDYSDKTLNDNSIKQFSADWIITKNGNRALIYPMLAVEDGKYYTENTSQDNYHKKCYLHNFTEEFI